MAVFRENIHIDTLGKQDMNDISDCVLDIVKKSKIDCGIVHVFNVGSTGVIGTIEFESGLKKDLPAFLNSIIPQSDSYNHQLIWHDGNGHSHLQATIMGPEITIPFDKDGLMTGRWQQIFHYEADNKSRSRVIVVTVIG